MRALPVLALLSGCCYVEVPLDVSPVKPGQDEAVAVVRATWGVAPLSFALRWYEGAELDCAGGAGFTLDLPGEGPTCLAGVTEYYEPPRIGLAWEPGDTWSTTSLAHELCHLHFGDSDHLGPCGTVRPASKVLPAEVALRAWEAGL